MLKERAIILLHGYATNIDDLIVLKEELRKNYSYVCLQNLPGHGEEDIKKFNAIDTMIYVRDLCKKVFDKFEHVDIIGFSMGGAIATYLATIFEFEHVILLSPANKYLNFNIGPSRVSLFLEYLASRYDKKDAAQAEKDKFDIVLKNDKKSLKLALNQLLPNYTIHSLKEFKEIIDYCNAHIKGKVCNTKTCLIWGEMDQLVPQKVIKYLRPIFPKMEEHILKDMSHLMLHSDNYEEVTKIIYEFLNF